MGTVKYSGPIASFHCPTSAEIRSLKVHFSPKQLGEGTPSPENIRPIEGWDGVEVEQSGKNLMHLLGYSAVNLTTPAATRKLTNSNGTTISTINPEKSITITQTLWPATTKSSYQNGYFIVMDDNLKFEEHYDISFRVTNIINNPLNATLTNLMLYNPKGTSVGGTKIIDGDRITFKNAIYNQNTATPLRHGFDIRICGMSCTISDFIVTAVDAEDRTYEPYRGETIDYEFGVLGKNKFNWNVEESVSTPVSSSAETARTFTLGTYVVGMSVANYYRQNYANWVLNPSVVNGTISFSSGNASGYGIAFPLQLAAGQTYFLSGTGNGSAGATYYDKEGNMISYQNGRLNKTITVPYNTVTTLIGFYASTANTDFTFSDIQLELGSTATAYEPYDPNKTVYGGWVDLVSGEVCEEWGSSKCGDLSWYRSTTTNTYYYYETTISNKARTKEAMCAKYNSHDVSRSNLQNYDLGYYYPSETYYHRIAIRDDTYNDLESFISDNANTLIYYEVTTPITYHLAPTQLQTFLSHNNIWSNADYVEVEYDLHETQTILARKQFIMANQPHIVKPAAAPLQSFTTDIAAPLKECKVYFSPVQEGTGDPSPENVRVISGWNNINIYTAGENLIPVDYEAVEGKWKPTEGVISASVYNMGQFPVPSALIQYQSETKGITYFGFMDGPIQNGEPVYDVITMSNRSSYPFDNTNGHQYALITGNRESVDSHKVIISVGHTYKEYSEPSGTTIPITFPSEAGTVYGGYVDLVTGEVVQEWETVKIADLNWNNYSAKIHYYSNLPSRERNTYIYTDTLTPRATGAFTQENVGELTYYGEGTTATYKYIWTRVPEAMETTAANEWIKNTYADAIICYKLETPIVVATLTPIQLKTLRGANNVWSNANGNIELSYWKH